MKKKKDECCCEHEHNHEEEVCNCNSHCTCGDDCHCDENHKCSDECTCGDECHCGDECTCGDECHCHEHKDSKEELLLNMARQIQAEFDNYRKRSYVEIENARQNGMLEAIKVLLPAIDSIKKAKTMIKDETVNKGLDMILNDIKSSLVSLNVEEIKSIGEKLNPNLHNVVAVVNTNADDDIIVDEYQTGYKLKDKIIRYSQVIVNKKGE